MSLTRWNPRRDGNEAEIVRALERVGAKVLHLSDPGTPDLLVGFRGRWTPLEIKKNKPRRTLTDRKGRSLTPAQCASYAHTPFAIVRTVDEALQAIGAVS